MLLHRFTYLLTYLLVDSGEEMQQKQQLEEQLRAYLDKKRYKKRQIRELSEDLQVCQSLLPVYSHCCYLYHR